MKPLTPERAQQLVIAQLVSSRESLLATVNQIDVALFALGVDVDAIAPATDGSDDCPHPPDQVTNHHNTLDDDPDDWECLVCRARQTKPFHQD